MKDLHCHILYGIDDGAKTIDESIKMLKRARLSGITDCVLTPHYIEDSDYMVDECEKKKLFNKLKQQIKSEDIDINIYMGSEVYIIGDIVKLYKNKKISTINKTKYMLIEFPLSCEFNLLNLVIDELLAEKIIPIIAHPERYLYYDDYSELLNLRDKGCLFQGNVGSLFDKYGKMVRKRFIKLLKLGLIQVLGSDSHSEFGYYDEKLVRKKLKKILKNDDLVEDLLVNNFDKLIRG